MRIVDLILRFEAHSKNARAVAGKEIFELLHNQKIINDESFEGMKRLIFLRNLISREYHKITKEELLEMVTLLKGAEKLIEWVREAAK